MTAYKPTDKESFWWYVTMSFVGGVSFGMAATSVFFARVVAGG